MGSPKTCHIFRVVFLLALISPGLTDHVWEDPNGTFTCRCNTGYLLGSDGNSCTREEVSTCTTGSCQNGGSCLPTSGGNARACVCPEQYTGDSCQNEVNTCTPGSCQNGGSCLPTSGVNARACVCLERYTGNACQNEVSTCTLGSCQNGGSCVPISEGNARACLCMGGFTGDSCQNEIITCTPEFCQNGGTCVLTSGGNARACACPQGYTGDSCQNGGEGNNTIFRRLGLPRNLLPKGCATLFLTRCTDGRTIEVFLSSTSFWYQLTDSNNNIISFTFGIVFVEVNSLSLPLSLNGAEVVQNEAGFSISLGTNGRTPSDEQQLPVTRTEDCISFDFTAADIQEFIDSISFLNSYFDQLIAALPPWLGFSGTQFSAIDTTDLRTDLVYGRDMDDVEWCEGAPVLPNHLYSVFRFSSTFVLSLYGNQVSIPKPLNGREFCLIVDICHNLGGSVFIMVPEESRDLLKEFDVFKKLEDEQNISIKPRGIGLSVVNGVNVRYVYNQGSGLQLWNGDNRFTYPYFPRAALWIGGEFTKESKAFKIRGSGDAFVSVPSVDRMLTALFIDEWNALVRIRASATPTLTFKLFKKTHQISFPNMVNAAVDVRMSIGGLQDRQWCGPVANPPGIFLATSISVNPFQTVPILKDWIFNAQTKLYAFITIEPTVDITSTQIDILNDIAQLNQILDNLKRFVGKIQDILTDDLTDIIEQITSLQDTLAEIRNEIEAGNFLGVIDLLSTLWNDLRSLESDVTNFLDKLEPLVNEIKDEIENFIKNEMAEIKSNVDQILSNVRDQILGAVEDYSGFGLKFKTSLNIFKLKIFGVDLELVYSVGRLFQCSKFEKVKKLLEGEKAVRILGTLSKGMKIGFFLKLDAGIGIGGAMSIDTDKFIIQITSFVKIIGIQATVDVFLSKSGIYIYFEGNVWNLFLAQIEMTAELGKEWHDLTFNLKGTFGVAGGNSYQASYLDALTNVIQRISTEVRKRLTQAQTALSKAQKGLTSAQNWLEDKKKDVQNANKAFDNAIKSLENFKDKLEKAKGPFEKALAKLNAAQKAADKICKIKTCPKICVPGLSCKICYKKVWGAKIPYPCCKVVKCKHKIPNVICEAGNVACRAVRALAFGALELAKAGVKVPLLALDAAKKAVSLAQIVVDKSRIVLKAAEAILDVAKIGLQAAKVTLEVAKKGLEVVKVAIGIGANILEQVIKFGLKNIIDVRNCGFEITATTKDLPVFQVFCQVNAFRLGWRKIQMKINFNNILQSIWQAAKATIDALKNALKNVITGRKKRDMDFKSSLYLHKLMRKIRQTDVIGEDNTLNIIKETVGFSDDDSTDAGNRILIYKTKCELYRNASSYLNQTFALLHELISYSVSEMEALEKLTSSENTTTYTSDDVKREAVQNAAIDKTYLGKTYGVSMQHIDNELANTVTSFNADELLNDLLRFHDVEMQSTKSNIESYSSSTFTTWIDAVQNGTPSFYDKGQCTNVYDCLYHASYTLYQIHEYDTYQDIGRNRRLIRLINEAVFRVMDNTTTKTIRDLLGLSKRILKGLSKLNSTIPYCTPSPYFTEEPQNTTAVVGSSVTFWCKAEPGDTILQYSWLMDGEMLEDQSSPYLTIERVSDEDAGVYECVVGNVVANITSGQAYLTIKEQGSNPDCVESCDGREDGNYHSCKDCNHYVSCTGGTLLSDRPCPTNLVWDDNLKRCEYTSNTCGGVPKVPNLPRK